MQAMPRRPNGWWISPAVPTIANVVLAALWGFSAFGGWGRTAFCHGDGTPDARCSHGFNTVIATSAVPAILALVLVAGSWALPALRRDTDLLDALLTIAAFTWVLAEGILFVGGYLVQP